MFSTRRRRSANRATLLAPVKLAVFDFELEDFSGGAGIIPESDRDREQLRLATETARRLLVESGRYSLVDVSRADAAGRDAPIPCANATVATPQLLANSARINPLSGSSPASRRTDYAHHIQVSRHADRRSDRRRADRPSHRRELFLEPRRRVAHQEPVAGETSPAISVRPRRP